jgi:hypothetical protein
VSAEIKDGSGNSVGSIASEEMDKPGTDLYGVTDGADPLTVVVPSFTVKSIGQSTPASGATNTLTVSLTADFDLPAGSTVTITGLTGSQTTGSSVTVTSTGHLLGTSGAWTQTPGQLVLTVASGGTVSGTPCVVTFALTNKATAQVSPAVNVSAEIKDGSGNSVGSIASEEMDKPGTDLYGVTDGADPLTVVVPSFTVKSIGQSTPASGATNTLTVSLTADFDLPAGSTVTITGLTGSQTTGSSVTVTSTGHLLGTSGAWTQTPGQLVLTVASGGTVSGTPCVVTFALTNKATAQVSPAVNVSAEIKDGSGNSVGSIASQSTPFSGANNELTVNLTSNCDLPEGSKVTITGLTGSATDTSATLSVQSTSDKLGAQGNWNKDGALILTAASGGVLVGVSVEVKFNLSNPSTGYTSPSVSVEAAIEFSGTAVGTIQRVSMTKPNSTLFGVAHGRNPLQVLVPDLTVKTIQQSTPFSGANNELTVNLTSNCDLPEGSKVTITGLTGSDRAEHAGVGCDQHVDSFADGRLRPAGGVYGDHHGADGIADSGQ